MFHALVVTALHTYARMMDMGRVTSQSVAREAGVSQSTVSRVFSAGHLVTEATRDRVLAAAERLGYRFDPTGRALRTGQRATIGVVVPDLSNTYFAHIVQQVAVAARSGDRQVLLAEGSEDPAVELDTIQQVASLCDGVIVCAPRSTAAELTPLPGPLVVAGRGVPGLRCVTINESAGMRTVLDHLTVLGHRRIAVMGGPARSASHRSRAAAVRHWGADHDVELTMVNGHPPTTCGGIEAAAEIIESGATAAVSFNDRTGLAILSELAAHGVEVPGAMSMVTWDDTDLTRVSLPPLTSVRMPVDELGRTAAEMLMAVLECPDAPITVRDLPVELVIRASTGPAPRRRKR